MNISCLWQLHLFFETKVNNSSLPIKFRYNLPICHGVRFDTVHKIPQSGARRNAWLEVLSDYRDHLEELQTPTICGRHFRPEDYVHAESRCLNRIAVPSLNLKGLNQLDICKQVNIYQKQQQYTVCIDENNVILESKIIQNYRKIKQKNEPNAEVEECKRKKLNILEVTQFVDTEQNMLTTVDELETPLLEYCDDNTEINECTDDEEDPELVEELEEIIDFGNDECTKLIEKDAENATEDAQVEQTSFQNNSADFDGFNDIEIQLESHEIIIHHASYAQTLKLNYLWLRDYCKCADCYDLAKHGRLFDITDLSPELRPESASLFQDNILVEWNDGHVSKYIISELFAQPKLPKLPSNQIPWSAKQTQGANFYAMPYNILICDNVAIKTAFQRLQRTGVLVIKDISANAQQRPLMLELLLRRLFPHNSQNHLKEERSNFNNSQSLPHTNCTFASESCGLQILSLSSVCTLESAQINIVDGLNVAQLLKENSCQVFDYLTHNKIPLIYRNAQNFDYHIEAPIFQLCNGVVERIKFAPYQRGDMPQTGMQHFTEALSKLTSITTQKQQQMTLSLSKDMLIILDNYRIFWQFERTESQLSLDCVYMERKDFLSQLHCLQRQS